MASEASARECYEWPSNPVKMVTPAPLWAFVDWVEHLSLFFRWPKTSKCKGNMSTPSLRHSKEQKQVVTTSACAVVRDVQAHQSSIFD